VEEKTRDALQRRDLAAGKCGGGRETWGGGEKWLEYAEKSSISKQIQEGNEQILKRSRRREKREDPRVQTHQESFEVLLSTAGA